MLGDFNQRLNLYIEFLAKIEFIRARDMILISKSIYLIIVIQRCIYKNLNITHSHNHVQFLPRRPKTGSIKARDIIFVPKIRFSRPKEFNGTYI